MIWFQIAARHYADQPQVKAVSSAKVEEFWGIQRHHGNPVMCEHKAGIDFHDAVIGQMEPSILSPMK